MSARTIKNPASVSGQGNLASDSLTLSNTVNCVLTSNNAGQLLVGGVPVGGGGGGAVDSIIAGDGITVDSATGDVTVSNTGLLSATAGDGISATTVDGVVTVANTGLLSATAGDGISATTVDGVVTVANTGVLDITAGTNITISNSNSNYTINSIPSVSTNFYIALYSPGLAFPVNVAKNLTYVTTIPYSATAIVVANAYTSSIDDLTPYPTLNIKTITTGNSKGFLYITIFAINSSTTTNTQLYQCNFTIGDGPTVVQN